MAGDAEFDRRQRVAAAGDGKRLRRGRWPRRSVSRAAGELVELEHPRPGRSRPSCRRWKIRAGCAAVCGPRSRIISVVGDLVNRLHGGGGRRQRPSRRDDVGRMAPCAARLSMSMMARLRRDPVRPATGRSTPAASRKGAWRCPADDELVDLVSQRCGMVSLVDTLSPRRWPPAAAGWFQRAAMASISPGQQWPGAGIGANSAMP